MNRVARDPGCEQRVGPRCRRASLQTFADVNKVLDSRSACFTLKDVKVFRFYRT